MAFLQEIQKDEIEPDLTLIPSKISLDNRKK